MAIAITDTGVTAADTLIPEVWSAATRDTLLPNLVMGNIVDRSFEEQLSGMIGDKIHVGGVGGSGDSISGFDPTDGATSTTLAAGATLNAIEMAFQTDIVIDIGTHAYKLYDLEHELDLFTQFDLLERGAARATFAVAQKVDADGTTLIDDFSNSVGTLAVGLSDENILRSVQYLNDANAQEDGRFMLVSAAQQLEFLKIEKYVNQLYSTSASTATPEAGTFRGRFGNLYGVEMYMSTATEGTNAAGHDNGMWQREALALVMVDNMRTADDYEISTDSHRFAVHAIYGWKEIRDTSGVWNKGK